MSELVSEPVSETQTRDIRAIVESLVFVSEQPATPQALAKIVRVDAAQVRRVLEELGTEYKSRGVVLEEVAGGWQFRTNAEVAAYVREYLQARPMRLSRAALETLAIVAYRQPLTRPEIEDVRGVDSGGVLKLLLERSLVRIIGKKEEPGRPLLYGTTTAFLEFFNLKSLRDLPTLREFAELTEESQAIVEREMASGAEPAVAAEGGGANPVADPIEPTDSVDDGGDDAQEV